MHAPLKQNTYSLLPALVEGLGFIHAEVSVPVAKPTTMLLVSSTSTEFLQSKKIMPCLTKAHRWRYWCAARLCNRVHSNPRWKLCMLARLTWLKLPLLGPPPCPPPRFMLPLCIGFPRFIAPPLVGMLPMPPLAGAPLCTMFLLGGPPGPRP